MSKFKVGDLVEINPDNYPLERRSKLQFPWKVVKVEGKLVTVERISKKGKVWRDVLHEDFLIPYKREKE